MRMAVVASGIHDRWDEPQLTARRIAGALAHEGRVSLFIAGDRTSSSAEGMFDVHRHAAVPPNHERGTLLGRALAGASTERRAIGHGVRRLEEEYFLARGEYAPGLVAQLGSETFDLVVLVGLSSGHATFAARVIAPKTHCLVAPVPTDRASLRLSLVHETLARADAVLMTSEVEAQDVEHAFPGAIGKSTMVGTVVRTNELATQALPAAYPDEPTVVVAADWERVEDCSRWARWGVMLNDDLRGRAQVRAIGPSANRLPGAFAGASAPSRIDLWRWMSHALAVVDPTGYRAIGFPTLEAMSFGVPVLGSAEAGATRFHAETSNGGLWFRTYEELRGCIEYLLVDDRAWSAMGSRGKYYAEDRFASTESFVAAVLKATAA